VIKVKMKKKKKKKKKIKEPVTMARRPIDQTILNTSQQICAFIYLQHLPMKVYCWTNNHLIWPSSHPTKEFMLETRASNQGRSLDGKVQTTSWSLVMTTRTMYPGMH